MTVKVVVLYSQPDDPEAFDSHYLSVHGPLVEKIPGLERWESAKFVAPLDGGEPGFYRTAELYFSDPDSMGQAMSSPEGQATSADFQQIAPPGSRIFLAAVD
jgi:uncharacterized protein (TIGR02118 family)